MWKKFDPSCTGTDLFAVGQVNKASVSGSLHEWIDELKRTTNQGRMESEATS
jgi:hypothetical protein